jgi:hypothetical protein
VLGYNVDRIVGNTGNLPYSLLNGLRLREVTIRYLDRMAPPSRPSIFVISPGRSGSRFLAALLDATANAAAVHEPRPRVNGMFLRGLSDARLAATYAQRRVKIVQILRSMRAVPRGWSYVETSHMFVKTFYDVVLDFFPDVKVVHLRRSLPHVIKSFAELGYLSPASTHWRYWMHDPYSSEPLVPPAVEAHEADDFDRIIAYLIDIEARAERLRVRYPATTVVKAQLEEITDPMGARRLVGDLQLEWDDAVAKRCSQRRNTRDRQKRAANRPVDLDYCRDRLQRYVALAKERSLPLPEGLF